MTFSEFTLVICNPPPTSEEQEVEEEPPYNEAYKLI
jgi:tRNA1(Val) A37 N6-methylase TrmN6